MGFGPAGSDSNLCQKDMKKYDLIVGHGLKMEGDCLDDLTMDSLILKVLRNVWRFRRY